MDMQHVNSSSASEDKYEAATNLIALIAPPILVLIGVVGNILSIIVYKRRWCQEHARSYTAILMVQLVVDTIHLGVNYTSWWLLNNLSGPCVYAKMITFFSNLLSHIDVWLLVLMTFHQVLVVLLPFRGPQLMSVRRALFLSFVIICFFTALNLHAIFAIAENSTYSLFIPCPIVSSMKWWYTIIWRWLNLFLNSCIPGGLILFMNCIIVCKIRQATSNLDHNASQLSVQKRIKRERIKTTFQLTLSFGVLAFTMPYMLYRICIEITGNQLETTLLFLIRTVLVNLLYVRFASNIFFFVVTSSAFRNELFTLLNIKLKMRSQSNTYRHNMENGLEIRNSSWRPDDDAPTTPLNMHRAVPNNSLPVHVKTETVTI